MLFLHCTCDIATENKTNLLMNGPLQSATDITIASGDILFAVDQQ
jgi:hypothetical protein